MNKPDALSRRRCAATADYPSIREAQTMLGETAKPIPPNLAKTPQTPEQGKTT